MSFDTPDRTPVMQSVPEECTELIASIENTYADIHAIPVTGELSFDQMAHLGYLIDTADSQIQHLLYAMRNAPATQHISFPDSVKEIQTHVQETLAALCEKLSQYLSNEASRLTVEQPDEESAAFEDKLAIFNWQIGMLSSMHMRSTGQSEGVQHITTLESTHSHFKDCVRYQHYLKKLKLITDTPDYFALQEVSDDKILNEFLGIQFDIAAILDDLTWADEALLRQDPEPMHPLFAFNTITLRREVLQRIAGVQNTILTHILAQMQSGAIAERGITILNHAAIDSTECTAANILTEIRGFLKKISLLYGKPYEDIQQPYTTLAAIDFLIQGEREKIQEIGNNRPKRLN